ncbi:MAG: VWA domain-containing protein, partial [Bacteroidota bacterium]
KNNRRMSTPSPAYPFSAIVGQEPFKKALTLALIDPSIGGVLAIGDRGAGKTTLIRSLAQLMTRGDYDFPFVNLPIGATEDRLLGHVNIEQLIRSKEEKIHPGMLANAHGGILYVDEINLLNDYLMDILLDASASGHYFLEREGLSTRFDSRFVLIGSMNPEEGMLRPQLKDRFGFCVEVTSPNEIAERVEVIEKRLLFDKDPQAFVQQHEEKTTQIRAQISQAQERLKTINVSKERLTQSASLALSHQVEGLRADVLLIKAATALAAYRGEDQVTERHIEEVAPLVLTHRSNRPPQQDRNPESAPKEPQENPASTETPPPSDIPFEPLSPHLKLETRKGTYASKKGNDRTEQTGVAQRSTNRDAMEKTDVRKTVNQYVANDKFTLQKKYEDVKAEPKLVFIIDASGSMMKDRAISYAKGLINETALKRNKTDFAIISVHHSEAEVLQHFTREKKAIIHALDLLPVGGKTNMIAGITLLQNLIQPNKRHATQVVILTDGRFNTGVSENVFEATVQTCQKVVNQFEQVTVVDSESGTLKIGLARTFSEQIGVGYEKLTEPNYA